MGDLMHVLQFNLGVDPSTFRLVPKPRAVQIVDQFLTFVQTKYLDSVTTPALRQERKRLNNKVAELSNQFFAQSTQ
jgi:hypothetical protein